MPLINPALPIKVMTISSQIVYQQEADSKTVQLDLSVLPAGTYLLELSSNGERQLERLILH